MAEDDTVAGFAAFEVGEGFIGLVEPEVLGDGLDVMEGCELDHLGHGRGAADGGAGDLALGHNEREGADLDGLEGSSEKVESALGLESVDVAAPVEADIHGGEDEIEASGRCLDFGVVARV